MKNLFKALADFQQEVPVIHKGTQGYGYSYADLPAIFEKINPLLKKHGLGFTQLIMGDCVKTIVYHVSSGELIESLTQIPQGVQLKGMNDFQVLGSAITYIRRYALSSALGLVTDKDTDAGGEQVKETPKKEETQKANSGMSIQQACEVLKTATTLDMLKKLYESLPKLVSSDSIVIKTKDELKAKLK